MPVKNAGKHLKDCLNSIINQDFKDWELLAVNDHSEDETLDILKFYAQIDQRIQYFNNIGNGIIYALRLAYQNTTGDYITRMDADDIMPSDKLTKMHTAILNNTNTVVTGKVKYIADDKLYDGYKAYESWLNNLVDKQSHFQEIYKECVIPSPCWMLSKVDFEKCGAFSSSRYPEDYDLCFRFYENKLKVIVIPEVMHIWRDHSSRASRNDKNYSDNAFLDIKTYYFLKLDFDNKKKLVLWGAGKKAKKIAQLLLSKNINFFWACNNDKKIGHIIYSKEIQDVNSFFLQNINYQSIITIANKEEQKSIKTEIFKQKNIEAFWFC